MEKKEENKNSLCGRLKGTLNFRQKESGSSTEVPIDEPKHAHQTEEKPKPKRSQSINKTVGDFIARTKLRFRSSLSEIGRPPDPS